MFECLYLLPRAKYLQPYSDSQLCTEASAALESIGLTDGYTLGTVSGCDMYAQAHAGGRACTDGRHHVRNRFFVRCLQSGRMEYHCFGRPYCEEPALESGDWVMSLADLLNSAVWSEGTVVNEALLKHLQNLVEQIGEGKSGQRMGHHSLAAQHSQISEAALAGNPYRERIASEFNLLARAMLLLDLPNRELTVPEELAPTCILDHILNSLVSGSQHDYDIFMDWMAYMAQNPGRKFAYMPFFVGDEGTGKGVIITKLLLPLFGKCRLRWASNYPPEQVMKLNAKMRRYIFFRTKMLPYSAEKWGQLHGQVSVDSIRELFWYELRNRDVSHIKPAQRRPRLVWQQQQVASHPEALVLKERSADIPGSMTNLLGAQLEDALVKQDLAVNHARRNGAATCTPSYIRVPTGHCLAALPAASRVSASPL
ncbi:hypothetical protein WJX77_002741 [Trebouxia sp. C0004]